MTDDPTFKMYEAQAELLETKEKLEKIQKENDELKNQVAANNLMKTVDNFQRNNFNRFETIEENLRRLTTTVFNHDDTFAEIKEMLKGLKETIQVNFGTLSTEVSTHDQILSGISETLRKPNETLITQAETLNKSNEINEILNDQNKQIHSSNHMKITDKETILSLGGNSGSRTLDSLLILQNNEENSGNWKQWNIKLPYAVGGHGAQFLNNCLYIFGGQNEKDEVLSSSYKLRKGHKWLTNSLQWDKITNMNQKRTSISNSTVILNYRIWVIGGKGEKRLKSVEMYDPQRNIWKNMKEMNECRSVAAAAVVHGKIFCCGGYNGKKFLRSAEYYDPSSDVWTPISDMPGPNGGCGIVEMDGNLIVIGGKASKDKDYLNSVWVLDTADKNESWTEREPRLPRPRCQFSVAKIDDKIFVCGGVYMDQKDSKRYNTSEVEIFDGEVWRNGSKLNAHRHIAPAVVIPIEFARFLN